MKNILLATVVAISAASMTQASTTIDFTTLDNNTVVSDQFAGVSFALSGGPATGSPLASNVWSGGTIELNNSPSGDYPTADSIVIIFTNAANNISLSYDNYGSSGGGRGASYYNAYDSLGAIIGTGSLNGVEYGSPVYIVASGDVSQLILSNNTGGTDSWEFGVRSLTFDAAAVPEPASWAMMVGGFGLMGATLRRKKSVAVSFG